MKAALSPFLPPISAVLLAGGRSSRMGRDKAQLPLPDGRTLWRRQIDDVLRPLDPVEMFLSGPAREGLPADVRVLPDAVPGGLGPLAGIAAALGAMTTRAGLLIVLAVDLPAMSPEFIRGQLGTRCRAGGGAVPRGADGFFEPLAAIYPKECLPLAAQRLREPDRSLQTFVRAAQAAGLIDPVDVTESDMALFINWNEPRDVALDSRGAESKSP